MRRFHRPANRRGFVLLLVLVVVAGLALAVYAFANIMLTHDEATQLTGKQIQAQLLAESGLEAARSFMSLSEESRRDAGGVWNNAAQFQAMPILVDASRRPEGCCTLIAPNLNQDGNPEGVRYGLQDESTRLNLNVVLQLDQQQPGVGRMLMKSLPGMTDEIADAILDFMDDDDEPRDFGAEAGYYTSLQPAYSPKNGPLDAVEELLLVRGVTPYLLFGADVNRNGRIDDNESMATQSDTTISFGSTSPAGESNSAAAAANEASGGQATQTAGFGAAATEAIDEDQYTTSGWADLLTLYSRERNVSPDGRPRVFLNLPDAATLHQALLERLPPEHANFLVLYRIHGPGQAPAANGNVQNAGAVVPDLKRALATNYTQALDVLDAWVTVPGQNGQPAISVRSPWQSADLIGLREKLFQLMDHVSVNPAESIPGRINVNQATARVLRGVPGMDDAILEAILQKRNLEEDAGSPLRRHEVWLLTEGVVTLQQMKLLMPFLTGGGHVFRAQAVGYLTTGEAASRVEAVIDAVPQTPRLVMWKELSHLGRGYSLETLGLPVDAVASESDP